MRLLLCVRLSVFLSLHNTNQSNKELQYALHILRENDDAEKRGGTLVTLQLSVAALHARVGSPLEQIEIAQESARGVCSFTACEPLPCAHKASLQWMRKFA